MKETAVEWLINQIKEDQTIKAKTMDEWNTVFHQSKAMHKEEHDKTSKVWFNEGTNVHNGRKYQNFEQYYKETFKSEQNEY